MKIITGQLTAGHVYIHEQKSQAARAEPCLSRLSRPLSRSRSRSGSRARRGGDGRRFAGGGGGVRFRGTSTNCTLRQQAI